MDGSDSVDDGYQLRTLIGNYSQCNFCHGTELEIKKDTECIECTKCHRIQEERRSVKLGLSSFLPFHSTLCVISPDLLDKHEFSEAIDGDPYLDKGFITAFSVYKPMNYQFSTLACTSHFGDLCELEKQFEDVIQGVIESPETMENSIDQLAIYYTVKNICMSLEIGREDESKAYQLALQLPERNDVKMKASNTRAIAAAAVYSIAKDPKSMNLICFTANTVKRDVQDFLGDSVSSQNYEDGPGGFVSIYATALDIPDGVAALAKHIAVKSTSFSNRRNPTSVSAASIYLACRLENAPRKQKEICTVARLTEVTLRKVYKELLMNVKAVLPDDYIPKKSVEDLKRERGKYVSNKRAQAKAVAENMANVGPFSANMGKSNQYFPQNLVFYPQAQGNAMSPMMVVPSYQLNQQYPIPGGMPHTRNSNVKPTEEIGKAITLALTQTPENAEKGHTKRNKRN